MRNEPRCSSATLHRNRREQSPVVKKALEVECLQSAVCAYAVLRPGKGKRHPASAQDPTHS
eukprot:6196815-Pleurochrysis_carterae.AAC.3